MVRLIAALVLVLGLLWAPATVAAADPVTFGTPTAKAAFGREIRFSQPVTLGGPIARAEILLTFPGAIGPEVIEVDSRYSTSDRLLTYAFDLADDGFIAPNTVLTARWRLFAADAASTAIVGPPVTVRYEDDRFDWRTASGDIVRVHWYQGDAAFGARALRIGEEAVRSSSELMGVTETEPIDFFIYADQASFYDALGPGTRENVGGQANSDIRTLFALIRPTEISDSWVGVVIPHELTHLVFDTAVKNPYHFPPRWLNEGVAEYQSEGYDASYRSTIDRAARDGELIPLDGLTGQFPTTFDRFNLAYAESTAAVDYLVQTYGQDALVDLIGAYAAGRTDDEAFTVALGMDATAFGDAWLASVGAVAPTRYGPQPAVPGPVPSAWQGVPAPGTTAAPSAGGPATSPAPGIVTPGHASGGEEGVLVTLAIAAIVAVAVLTLYGVRRRQDAGASG